MAAVRRLWVATEAFAVLPLLRSSPATVPPQMPEACFTPSQPGKDGLLKHLAPLKHLYFPGLDISLNMLQYSAFPPPATDDETPQLPSSVHTSKHVTSSVPKLKCPPFILSSSASFEPGYDQLHVATALAEHNPSRVLLLNVYVWKA